MDSRVLQRLMANRDKIRTALLERKYGEGLRLISSVCAEYMIPRSKYDMFDLASYSEEVSEKLGMDYVNASFVPFENQTYIACQHPKKQFHSRFFEFLSKSRASLIISLTEFPLYFSEEHTIASKSVPHGDAELFQDEECLFHSPSESKIRRIKCSMWKDHGVLSKEQMDVMCDYVTGIVDEAPRLSNIVTESGINSSFAQPGNTPTFIIHCLAGVGRTGTFLMYYLLKNNGPVSPDLFLNLLIYLRACRPYAVESAMQLEFLAETFLFAEKFLSVEHQNAAVRLAGTNIVDSANK